MPTQEYHCPTDGPFDVHLTFAEDVAGTLPCPTCGHDSRHILRAPAGGAHFARTWNEKANEFRRDPYTQGKAQVTHEFHGRRDLGEYPTKPTEDMYQAAAKGIYEESLRTRPSLEIRNIRQTMKKNREKRAEKKQPV